jgi:mannosyltransferase
MSFQNASRIAFFSGITLIIIGLFLPTTALIGALRPDPGELMADLVTGATYFKIGLVVFGMLLLVVPRLPIWDATSYPSRASDQDGLAVQGGLAALLVIALGLRLYWLNSGLWLDEILAYATYMKLSFGEIATLYDSQNQHFLFTLLAKASLAVFGESAGAFRLPAVLFGVGSIWALYLFARQVASAREALITAALLTFSYHHVWFSQNARGYSGLLFWSLLSSWLFVRATREERPQIWLLYAIAVALGVYTHITLLFVVFAHFLAYLWMLVARRKDAWSYRWIPFVFGFGLAGLITIQLHALVLPQVLHGLVHEESTVEVWKQPLWTLLEFVRGIQIGFAGSVVAIGGLVVFGAGLLSFARTSPIVVNLLLVPAFICAVVTIGMGHHLWPRFFYFAFGFAALVAVRGTLNLAQISTFLVPILAPRRQALATVACVGLVIASALSVPMAFGPKQDYLGALNLVESERQAGDAIVTVGLATFPYRNYYRMDWDEVETVEQLTAVRSQANRTWLVYTLPPHVEAVYPEVLASVRSDFQLVQRFDGTLNDGSVFVYRSEGTTPKSARFGQ